MPNRFEQRELLWQMVEEALHAKEPALAVQMVMGFNEESYRTIALQQFKQEPNGRVTEPNP